MVKDEDDWMNGTEPRNPAETENGKTKVTTNSETKMANFA